MTKITSLLCPYLPTYCRLRFTIPDTMKAYKSCVVKLRERQEALAGDRASRERLVQLEHGIIDIIEAGTGVLFQSGHAEKAVAVFQVVRNIRSNWIFELTFEMCRAYWSSTCSVPTWRRWAITP